LILHQFFAILNDVCVKENGAEVTTGRGKNQHLEVKKAGETRWGSHYRVIINTLSLFKSICGVLENVAEDGGT
jgi:hypothetical protein